VNKEKLYCWIYKLSFGFLLSVISVVSIAFYIIVFYQNPASTIVSPIPVDKDVYHIGDQIIGTIDYCRFTEVEFDTVINFINGIIYDLPTRHAKGAPVGCGIVGGRLTDVPEGLPVGISYRLEGTNNYEVFPGIWRKTPWYTEEFEVR